jgi:hypothetical protein
VLAGTGVLFLVAWLVQKWEHRDAARLMRKLARRCGADPPRGDGDTWTLVVDGWIVTLRFDSGGPSAVGGDRSAFTVVEAEHRGDTTLELKPASNEEGQEALVELVARARVEPLPKHTKLSIEDGTTTARVSERVWELDALQALVETVTAICRGIDEEG